MKWKEWFEAAIDEARWQDHEEKGLLKVAKKSMAGESQVVKQEAVA